MLRTPSALVILGALHLVSCAPPSATGTPIKAPTPDEAMRNLVVTRRVLENGLTILVHEDHSTPKVAVLVAHAGSLYDPPGREGMAHMFEHLMFGASREEPDPIPKLQAIGATDIAGATDFEFLRVQETVPVEQLPWVLGFEADRSTALGSRIDGQKLDAQRAVVKREIIASTRPYTKLEAELDRALFGADHPYTRSVTGELATIDAITVDEAKRYFADNYTSRRTIVVLAGDITLDKAVAEVRTAFGSMPDGLPRSPQPSLASTGPKADVRIDSSAVPVLFRSAWVTPAANTPGDAELDLAASVLSSRLRSRLVQGSHAALAVFVDNQSRAGSSRFRVTAKMRDDHISDEALRALDAELTALQDKGPSDAELAVARDELDRYMRSTNLTQRASHALHCARLGFLGNCADQMAARYAPITPDAVRDAVRALLPLGKRVVVATPVGPKKTP